MLDYNDLIDSKIKLGDRVTIITTERPPCRQEAIVINRPGGEGDLWEFRSLDGSVFALNPYHSSFVGIEKEPSG